jgi:DNA (cytosine-5)-methyltransferase 1
MTDRVAGNSPLGELKVRDLFAGSGWGVACQQLGWEEHGWEIMPEAQATRAAAGLKTAGSDVRDVDPVPGEFDLEIASPSCKRYSPAGNGAGRRALDAVLTGVRHYASGRALAWDEAVALIGDEDAALTLEPLRVALGSMPRFIAWEQVPAVLPVWKACADVLTDRGYSTAVDVLNAEQYGVPQTRRRAILVARRDEVPARLPEPTHSRYHSHDPRRLDPGVQSWVSMAEALGWDPDTYVISNYGTGGDPANRGVRRATQPAATITSKADRMKVVLRNNNNQPKACVRPIDEPAGTIFFGQRANWVAWESADEIRKITPVEAAVLQNYPPDFPFQGRKSAVLQQIGNAVPPRLALAILHTFEQVSPC